MLKPPHKELTITKKQIKSIHQKIRITSKHKSQLQWPRQLEEETTATGLSLHTSAFKNLIHTVSIYSSHFCSACKTEMRAYTHQPSELRLLNNFPSLFIPVSGSTLDKIQPTEP